jgi:predicted nucleic acid-binding protein
MPAKAFFDTNVLIYAIAEGDPRAARSEQLLAIGGVISVQVLNEFASVARRKLSMPWNDLRDALDAIRLLCPDPLPITISIHENALKIGEKYGFRIYDALIVAASLEAKCSLLYSEDFQHGQIIEDKLTIQNPFK